MAEPPPTLTGVPPERSLEKYRQLIEGGCFLTYNPATHMLFVEDKYIRNFPELCGELIDDTLDELFDQLKFTIWAEPLEDDEKSTFARADQCGLVKKIRKVDIEAQLFHESGRILDLTEIQNLLNYLQDPNLEATFDLSLTFDPKPKVLSEFWKTHYDIYKKELPKLSPKCVVDWPRDDQHVDKDKTQRVVEAVKDIVNRIS